MTRIVVRGGRTDLDLADRPTVAAANADLIKTTVKSAFTVKISRSGGSRHPAIEDAEPDDVLELTLADGVRMWTSVVQMQEDRGSDSTRSDQRDELVISPEMYSKDQTRGAAAWVLSGLRLLGVDLPKLAAEEIAEKLEDRLEPGPGLYLCHDPLNLGDRVEGHGSIPTDRPILVLLHGTASRTSSSFGDLVERSSHWDSLREFYGQNGIYAFEHKTLSQSPIVNANDLARLLPAGATVHFLSHSRGGLIGELLCRTPSTSNGSHFENTDRGIFKELNRDKDLEALTRLNDELKRARLTVGRFVRVACPVRGTLLASRRLDRYLSVMTNLMGLALPETQAFDLVSSLVLAVAKKRADVDTLPGLEAMMPSSPLIQVLNRPEVVTNADLSVVAGDLEGRGILGRLKTIATDIFYREDHDLVVNTAGMFGGIRRESSNSRYYSEKASDVNHFRYFRNPSSANKVVSGLTRADGHNGGFNPFPAPPDKIPPYSATRADRAIRPVVFVLPGIMGSHLQIGDDRIWVDPVDLAFGRLKELEYDTNKVTAEAPLGGTYGALIKYLGRTHETIPFAYDWRRSIRDEAKRLAGQIRSALLQTTKPVRIIAHSMGGLVARAMIAEHEDLWEKITSRPGGRLVMLGTPNGGSFAIPRMLLGHDRMVRMLALIDTKRNLEEVLDIVSRFPGVLEMLPEDEESTLFSESWWSELQRRIGGRWAVPRPEDLRSAHRTREILDASPIDPEHMVYVAGRHPRTPCRYRIEEDEIRFFTTPEGDGRVPWETGIPGGVETFYMRAEHGRLPSYKKAFPALLELLQTGFTSQLPNTKPSVDSRAVTEEPEIQPDPITVYPTESDVEAAAVGYEPFLDTEPEVQPLRVAVVHGNLTFAKHVLAVGHYENDTIVGAEAFLDRCLKGRLSLRRRLGVYPGPLGTSQVISNPGEVLPGALVVGLGPVGKLTRSDLTRTFATAVTALALKRSECDPGEQGTDAGDGAQDRPNAVTALLIGSNEAGVGVKDSVWALVEGINHANATLEKSDLGPEQRIEKFELLELYLDRAVQAMHALDEYSKRKDLVAPIEVEQSIRQEPGGYRRVFVSEDPSWWRRVEIRQRSEEDSSLVFTDLVDRARADVRLVPDHRDLLDAFIREAMVDGSWSRKRASAMFELLLPNELKESLDENRDIMLSLDPTAAAYPWELLHDRESYGRKPLAVSAGLIRQLVTKHGDGGPSNVREPNVLIVGDPVTCFRPLPAARAEAEKVEKLFHSKAEGYDVWSVINRDDREDRENRTSDDSGEVVAELFARPYRIMHIASHGLWEFCPHGDDCPARKDTDAMAKGPKSENCPDGVMIDSSKRCPAPVTGIAIGFRKYFKPSHVKQLRQVPELVFLNCCHSGRIQGDGRPDLAANMAEQFIRQGARAVVAAGWPVQDEMAREFARVFYEEMISNRTFGAAVHKARKAVYGESRAYDNVNTWGAYQCYGDPDYVLEPRRSTPKGSTTMRLCSPDEMMCELENIVDASATASLQDPEKLGVRLDGVWNACERSWKKRADTLAAMGRASGMLGRPKRAIEYLEQALDVDRALVPVKDIEGLALYKARLGVRMAKDNNWRSRDGINLIREGIKIITNLNTFGETTERMRLLGSCWKRLAILSRGAERKRCFERAQGSYESANEIAKTRTGDVDPHSLFSWLICRGVRRLRGKRDKEARLDSLIAEGIQVAEDLEDRQASYWNIIAKAEAVLAERIMIGSMMEEHRDAVIEHYERARRRGASPFQINAIRQHLELTAVLLRDTSPSEAKGNLSVDKRNTALKLANGLDAIHERLARIKD